MKSHGYKTSVTPSDVSKTEKKSEKLCFSMLWSHKEETFLSIGLIVKFYICDFYLFVCLGIDVLLKFSFKP